MATAKSNQENVVEAQALIHEVDRTFMESAGDFISNYAKPVGKAILAVGVVAGAAYAGYYYGVKVTQEAQGAAPMVL